MTLIPELESALVAAAQRQAERPALRRGRLGLGRRPLAVALATLLVGGGAAVAARLAIHEGPPIPPAPAGDYAPRYHMVAPKPGTERIVATAADPVSGPDWGMRVSRGADGSLCTGAGRLHNGTIGTYDASKRLFRALPLRGPDTCGRRVAARAVGLEGRWATEGPSQSRFVVSGLVGREVKSLSIRGPNGERPLTISREGAFIAVFPGRLSLGDTPVTATFADGKKA
ncbi:MAG: hypothetical protein QOH13_2420, partial [Thermoleophilaceae bacterium]|nr:hypothetical protein [Thermoleophilaceae bacterium]